MQHPCPAAAPLLAPMRYDPASAPAPANATRLGSAH